MTQSIPPLPSDNSYEARVARTRFNATIKALTDQRDGALNVVVNLQTEKAVLELEREVLVNENKALAERKAMCERDNAEKAQTISELKIVIANLQAQLPPAPESEEPETPETELTAGESGPDDSALANARPVASAETEAVTLIDRVREVGSKLLSKS